MSLKALSMLGLAVGVFLFAYAYGILAPIAQFGIDFLRLNTNYDDMADWLDSIVRGLPLIVVIGLIVAFFINMQRREPEYIPYAPALLLLLVAASMLAGAVPVSAEPIRHEVIITNMDSVDYTNALVKVTADPSVGFYPSSVNVTTLVFKDQANAPLNFTIDVWDTVAETAEFTVLVPFLPAGGSVTIYLEYGDNVDWTPYQQITIPVAIQENSGQTLANYPVRLELNQTNFPWWPVDPALFYVVNDTGHPLWYWLETVDNVNNRVVMWVNVTEIQASATTYIHIKYGVNGSQYNNGFNVFDFFDDFEDGIYTDRWSVDVNNGGTVFEGNGVLRITSTTSGPTMVSATISWGTGYEAFVRARHLGGNQGFYLDALDYYQATGRPNNGYTRTANEYSYDMLFGKYVSGTFYNLQYASGPSSDFYIYIWFNPYDNNIYYGTVDLAGGGVNEATSTDTAFRSFSKIGLRVWGNSLGNGDYEILFIYIRKKTFPEPDGGLSTNVPQNVVVEVKQPSTASQVIVSEPAYCGYTGNVTFTSPDQMLATLVFLNRTEAYLVANTTLTVNDSLKAVVVQYGVIFFSFPPAPSYNLSFINPDTKYYPILEDVGDVYVVMTPSGSVVGGGLSGITSYVPAGDYIIYAYDCGYSVEVYDQNGTLVSVTEYPTRLVAARRITVGVEPQFLNPPPPNATNATLTIGDPFPSQGSGLLALGLLVLNIGLVATRLYALWGAPLVAGVATMFHYMGYTMPGTLLGLLWAIAGIGVMSEARGWKR